MIVWEISVAHEKSWREFFKAKHLKCYGLCDSIPVDTNVVALWGQFKDEKIPLQKSDRGNSLRFTFGWRDDFQMFNLCFFVFLR